MRVAVLICAVHVGCVFDSSGLPPQLDTARDHAADAARSDGLVDTHLEATLRDLLLDHPIKDTPTVRDTPTVKDKPAVKDTPTVKDKPAVKDTAPVKPDGGGCVVESFATGFGQVQPKSGLWAVSGGAVRQSQTGAGNYAVIGGVTASDYVASALVTVHSAFPKPGWVVGAALGVRLQPSAALTPRQVLCGIYPGNLGLVIVHCSGGDPSNTCQVVRQTTPQITVGQQVLVRATVVGTSLTCELPQLGGKTTYDTGLTSGGPTLITQYVDASYDELSVCPSP